MGVNLMLGGVSDNVDDTNNSIGDITDRFDDTIDNKAYELPEYTIIIRDIAKTHEFEVGVWDCSNISELATKRLREQGYNAFYCVGYFQQETYKKDSLHAWVVIRLNDSVIRLDPTKYPHTKGIPDEVYKRDYESAGCYTDRFPDRLRYKQEWT